MMRSNDQLPDGVRSTASATPASAALCTHCALPVPAARLVDGDDVQFCCRGCETVYHAIHACGMDGYYAVRSRLEAPGNQARPTDRDFIDFDDVTFQESHCQTTSTGLRTIEFYLEGVHCGACVWLIERLPRIVDGVVEARLDFGRHMLTLTWDPEAVSLSAIAIRLDRLGYPPHPARGTKLHALRQRDDRRQLIRIGIAGAIAGNVMLIAFALYGGAFHGIDVAHAALFRYTSLGLATLAMVWPGRVFLKGAWGAIRSRVAHMDIPISVGLSCGYVWSAANTIRGTGEVYFDSVSMLVFLLLIGRWIQTRQQRNSYDAVEELFHLTPRNATRVVDDERQRVPIDVIVPGDVLEVQGGETMPVDGVVLEGSTDVDLALLTGESQHVSVSPGMPIHAGTVNQTRSILVEAKATGERTRLARLMQLVERHAANKPAIVQSADRIAGWFTVSVLVLALITFLMWLPTGGDKAVECAMALLIITCPCALGLATPLAFVAAIGRAAKQGILIKSGDVLEALARPGRIWLDKTGTITTGRPNVLRWAGDSTLVDAVAAIERHCDHPVARALRSFGDGDDINATDIELVHGGIRGVVARDELVIGNAGCMHGMAIPMTDFGARLEAEATSLGGSPVYVASNGQLVAGAIVTDRWRGNAKQIVATLEEHGWKPGILSGDHDAIVQRIGAELGLDSASCRGNVDPEGKSLQITNDREREATVMVGDGVNDAGALAAATVGVAVRGGAEASLAAADVYLSHGDLGALTSLLEGSRRAVAVVRRNLIFSLGYNTIGIGLAMAGLINPLVAAVVMPLGSLTVVVHSYRSRTFEGRNSCL